MFLLHVLFSLFPFSLPFLIPSRVVDAASPYNVRMILDYTKEDEGLESLSSLTDKVVQVLVPVFTTVHISQVTSEVEHLPSEDTQS